MREVKCPPLPATHNTMKRKRGGRGGGAGGKEEEPEPEPEPEQEEEAPGQVLPNILITGTPGTGKTKLSTLAAERLGMVHLNVGDIVKREGCHEGRDEEFDTLLLNEDKLVEAMRKDMEQGGCVVDFHSCDFFPEDWFQLVLVLRANTEILYDRLEARGYKLNKIKENVECEIMQVVADEVADAFPSGMVHELSSNTLEDLDSNVDRLIRWLAQWKKDNL